LTLLQAYGELLTSHPKYKDRYLAILDQLAKTEPNNPLVLSALARRAKLEGTSEGNSRALQHLTRAIELGSVTPSDFQDLAELLSNGGRVAEAIEFLKKGILVSPYTAALYKSLALHYIKLKRYPEALQTMKQELQLFPEDSFMRKLIKQVEGTDPSKGQ
jgi:tetratricopeptide (TPR) repeat protein